MTEQPVLVQTIEAAAANLSRGRFCTGTGAVPAAGALCLGVVHEAVAATEPVPVMTVGVALCETGNTITLTNGQAKVEVDSSGRVVPFTTGQCVGLALDAATGTGQFVRVLLGAR
jgi:hypothetical protein